MNILFSRQRGISLIEALVALVVISVGALSISRLHSNLIASSGLSKARSEAVQLAQGNNERLRNLIQQGQYNNVASGSRSSIAGINATFNLTWTVNDQSSTYTRSGTSVTYNYKRIATTVAWNDPKEGAQTVNQSAQVAWNDPVDSVAAAYGDSGGSEYASPQGKAVRADPNVEMIDRTKTGVQTIDEGGGYKILIDGSNVQLVSDTTNKVILTMKSSTPGQSFSTISGRVYIDKAHTLGTGNNQVDRSKVQILSSTEGECIRTFDTTDPNALFALFEQGPYYYYIYKCYVGEGWYGNIGVVRLDNAANAHRICVGDPTVSPTTAWSSRHPVMDTVRKYRGYVQNGTNVKAFGIGLSPDTSGYTATHYVNHQFLLTPITGNPNDASCGSPMQKDSNTLFVSNPGRNFCMTATCPGDPTPETTTTLIQGRISKLNDGALSPILSSIGIGSGVCSITATQDTYYDYQCLTQRSGWTGDTWSDDLTFTLATGNALCSTKSGNGAIYTTLDVANAKAGLREVPVKLVDPTNPEAVQTLTLNLQIGYSATQCSPPVTTTISGTITRLDSTSLGSPIDNALQLDIGNCRITSQTTASYGYECVINWTNWAGSNPTNADLRAAITQTTGPSRVLCKKDPSGPGVVNVSGIDRFIRFSLYKPTVSNAISQSFKIGRTNNNSCN